MSRDIILPPVKIIEVIKTLNFNPDNLDKIKAREVWEKTKQGSKIVVAVLDSGAQIDHPNLQENIIDGYNFTGDDNGNPRIFNDYNGHGTHVAGIISAKNTGEAIIGVAPKCKLLILKVIDKYGGGSYDQLSKAIRYAADWVGTNGETVNVINMSLGGPNSNDELHKAVKYARSKGIVLVAAAGNEGDGVNETIEVSYPGFYKEVIQVGSVSENNIPSFFSNSNTNLDFVGPGENILSTHLNNKFVRLTGTSMATPFVSGAAALIIKMIKRTNPHLIPVYVYNYLLTHSLPLEDFSINLVGNGFIQLK